MKDVEAQDEKSEEVQAQAQEADQPKVEEVGWKDSASKALITNQVQQVPEKKQAPHLTQFDQE